MAEHEHADHELSDSDSSDLLTNQGVATCRRAKEHEISDSDSDSDHKPGGTSKRARLSALKQRVGEGSRLKHHHHQSKEKGEVSLDTKSPFHFYLTTVNGIQPKYNDSELSIGINEILSEDFGDLVESVQFNYMFEVDWLVSQYPEVFRKKPLTLVHGCSEFGGRCEYADVTRRHSHIRLCHAPLPILYGTHHTKMMLLFYPRSLRVVIHTANLIQRDWQHKTQGVWISPKLPRLSDESGSGGGESVTGFKSDLTNYLLAYKQPETQRLADDMRAYDFRPVKVHLVSSVPGRHQGSKLSTYGHLRLRQLLQTHVDVEDIEDVRRWSVISQFSSIGSLGKSGDGWLTSEFLFSLSSHAGSRATLSPTQTKLKLVYPSVENVRLSVEGYRGGDCLPYSLATHRKQPYLTSYMYKWGCEWRGRTGAIPHIKSYTRISPTEDELLWFLCTSANLSKAAWGSFEKKGQQLMIRSYELGVLFLPKYYKTDTVGRFKIRRDMSDASSGFPLPFDSSLEKYTSKDSPFIVDQAYRERPDTHGNIWCPPTPR